MELYEQIKKLCKINGTSMSAIEKQLGMGNGTIGKWGKNGRVPNYANLCAVADALGITVAELTDENIADKEIFTESNTFSLVSKVRELCKKNKTSIAALERQLGFGNGVIGRWDKSVPNYDRLCAVADALGVTVSELTGDESTKKDPAVSGEVEGSLDAELIQRLIQLSPEEIKQVSAFVQGLLAAR